MIGERHTPKPPPQAPAYQPTGTDAVCSQCGGGIPQGGAWCPNCGVQAADPCWQCGRALLSGTAFCAHCGTPASEPAILQCGECRGIVGQGQGYCPQCGVQARTVCAECDRPLRADWQSCPYCGGDPVGEIAGTAVTRSRAQAASAAPEVVEEEPESPWAVARPAARDAERFNRQGTSAYEAEEYADAVRLFQQAVDADPENAGYWTNLGVALSAAGEDVQALEAYRRATAANPQEIAAYLYMGQLYLERESYSEAREAWEAVVRLGPDTEEAEEARENLRSLEDV